MYRHHTEKSGMTGCSEGIYIQSGKPDCLKEGIIITDSGRGHYRRIWKPRNYILHHDQEQKKADWKKTTGEMH